MEHREIFRRNEADANRYAALCMRVAAVVAVIAAVWFFTTEPVRHPREDVGGQIGVIQDGVYYVYAGSGVPAPKEARAPQGLVRYVPGQGKEVLVPYRDHRLDISGPVWGLNAQGLYYIDGAENQLWRLDLTTGEETLLYEAPTLSPGRWDRQDRPQIGRASCRERV